MHNARTPVGHARLMAKSRVGTLTAADVEAARNKIHAARDRRAPKCEARP